MTLNSFRIIESVHHSRRFVLYQAERSQDKKLVLIKTQDPMQINDHYLAESLHLEAEAAIELSHPCIRPGIACLGEDQSVYMVAEYAQGIAMAEYLLQNPEAASLDQCYRWARDILHALLYAQNKGIYHYNINPYNVIIDAQSQLKVIGFAKNRDAWKHSEGNFKYPYPMLYAAPEIFKTSNPHTNSDLYSWAVMVYQIFCHQLPWRLDSFVGPDEQKYQSMSRSINVADSDKIPEAIYSILLSCMKLDPADRPQDIMSLLDKLQKEIPQIDWTYTEPILSEQEETDADSTVGETVQAEQQIPKAEEDACSEYLETETQELTETIAEKESSEVSKAQLEENIIEDSLAESINDFPYAEQEEEIPPEDSAPPEQTPAPEFEMDKIPEVEEDIATEEIIPAQIEPEQKLEEKEEETIETEAGEKKELRVTEDTDSAIDADTDELSTEPAKQPEPEDVPVEEEEYQNKDVAFDALPETSAISEPQSADSIAKKELHGIQAKDGKTPEDNQDLSTMRKFFTFLMLISIAILAYILIQHFVLRQKPTFEVTQDEIPQDVEGIATDILTENKPLDMVWVPADTLIMGSINPEADADEFPLLTIPLKSFMITPTEVTQEQWNMVYSSNPSLNVGANLPVENVSFYDAIEYCNAKSMKDNLSPVYDYLGTEIICDFDADGYRLPTEAEWEFAAKAGIGKNFMLYSGSDDPQEVAWYSENSLAKSQLVATKKANALDLYDMSGNVYEWVWNWYAPYSYRISNLYSGPAEGTDKVIRGGSWYHNVDHLRTTSRDYVKPYVKTSFIGFRMVRSR